MLENNTNKIANDVNEYIFLLQRYSSYQQQLNEEARDTIKKYKEEEESR